MSRSVKKMPILGMSAGSQKRFRQQEHQRERTLVRSLLNKSEYVNLPSPKQFGDEWVSPRDGKMWCGRCSLQELKKWMRK